MSRLSLKGVFTALITPFLDGAVDEAAFVRLIERQIAAGVHGLVPVGTTGEGATLGREEHKRATRLCVEVAAGRVPVIAGCGNNATADVIELVAHARDVGAAAALVVTPYYNRPSQEGLYRHYEAIVSAVDLPRPWRACRACRTSPGSRTRPAICRARLSSAWRAVRTG
jgi:4-hydroxy-tetrahydrodipicolinate synthase